MTRRGLATLVTIRGWTIPNLRRCYDERQHVVWLLAPLIGFAAGAAAIAFRLGIGLVQWPWLHDISENVATAARAQPWWVVLTAPAIGGLIVGLIVRYGLTSRRAGGVPEVIEARISSGDGLTLTQGVASAIATVISLGSGASAGREGPVVHLGASFAAAICQRFRLPDAAKRTLLACGVAGTVSASFNTPIAGVLFAQEVILAHFALAGFAPLVLASVTATIVSRFWFGDVAAFTVPPYHITSYLEVPAFALLGVIAAGVAILFQSSLIAADRVARAIPMPLVARPVVGGLIVGAIALVFPEVLGVGYQATDAALNNELPILPMLALIVMKTLATAITLASRFGGGIFSPTLYLGAMTGGAFGLIAAAVSPGPSSAEGLYAILGMGAVAAAVLGAPISTAVIVFELTGGFALSLALLLTVAIAHGLFQAVTGRSWFLATLEARGLMLTEGPHKVLARQTRVADFMEPLAADAKPPVLEDGAATLKPTYTLETALRVFDAEASERLPVVDPAEPGRVIGHASQARALAAFNTALIAASVEEHR